MNSSSDASLLLDGLQILLGVVAAALGVRSLLDRRSAEKRRALVFAMVPFVLVLLANLLIR